MSPIVRSVMAVVIGCLAGFFHIGAIEFLNYFLYPPPAGLDPARPETIAAYMKLIPTGALLVVLVAWAVGTFAGSWITTRLAPRPKRNHGLAVGVFFLIAAIGNMRVIPHPAWFWVAGLASIAAASYLGTRLATTKNAPTSETAETGIIQA